MNHPLASRAYETLPAGGRAPLRSGKVRDLYDFGDSVLLVASDRISAFDVVFKEPVPGKGIVLSALSDYWLTKTAHIIKNHRITSDVERMPMLSAGDRERLRGRTMLCKKAPPFRYEFVVRGYLSGSGWSDYQKSGAICGIALPKGLRESDRLPQPILTPTTKEEAGHDRPVTFEEVETSLGVDRARAVRSLALRIYQFAAEEAAKAGIIIADTKFEFGESSDGEILLIDEALTPDSSRFWPAELYKPGGAQPSYDKQFVRDYLISTGWNKTPPPPPLPADVLNKTAAKYADICKRLTGISPEDYARRGHGGADATTSFDAAIPFSPIRFEGGVRGNFTLLDQTKLPNETAEIKITQIEQLYDSIHRLAVRGAPAIGVAGAFGMVIAARKCIDRTDVTKDAFLAELTRAARYLKSARPTAVNLAWAIDRVLEHASRRASAGDSVNLMIDAVHACAKQIEAEDRAACAAMGRTGADLLNLHSGDAVYTICNTGILATAGLGTALSVIYTTAQRGKKIVVFASETRPLLQGARLTAYELQRAGIDVRLVTDGMAARVFHTHKISAVLAGADRIAANGDTANKIGTHSLAIVAKYFNVPFYIVAPISTFDRSIPDGSGVPIEERSGEEITDIGGVRVAPEGVAAFNPAFDITPAALIAGIITDRGLIKPPYGPGIAALF